MPKIQQFVIINDKENPIFMNCRENIWYQVNPNESTSTANSIDRPGENNAKISRFIGVLTSNGFISDPIDMRSRSQSYYGSGSQSATENSAERYSLFCKKQISNEPE